jgi:UMF1 family MFS transporter
MTTNITVLGKDLGKREHWAWYMYDFGNSAYAAVVVLAVYSAYFQGTVVGGAEGSRLWGIAIGIAMLVGAIISPILATIADFTASKKRFLFVFSSLSWVFTALLFFVQKGDIFIGMLFFILAEIGYRAGQVFYNSLLPDITTPEEVGRVSGNGWAIGSAGGIICLLIILPFIVIIKNPLVVRASLAFTALFFAVSTIPIFLHVKEIGHAQTLPPGENYISLAFRRLWRTVRAVSHFREFVKFIIGFLVYNDGIDMSMRFASIIGAVMYGMNQQQLIILIIIVQVTSIVGAYVFGLVGEKIGFKKSLLVSLVLMIASVVWLIFNKTATGYFVIASLAGFALTGVQSVSRTMVSLFAPKGQSAEFFSFFAVAGKASSVVGPAVYGFLAAGIALRMAQQGVAETIAEQAGQRAGIMSIVVFLVVGTLLVLFANEKRARQAAEQYQPEVD